MGSSGAQPATRPLLGLLADEDAFCAWYDEVLTQCTMIAAVRGTAGFDARSATSTWLLTIARRQLADHYRRTGREHRPQARLTAAYADPAEAAWHRSATHPGGGQQH